MTVNSLHLFSLKWYQQRWTEDFWSPRQDFIKGPFAQLLIRDLCFFHLEITSTVFQKTGLGKRVVNQGFVSKLTSKEFFREISIILKSQKAVYRTSLKEGGPYSPWEMAQKKWGRGSCRTCLINSHPPLGTRKHYDDAQHYDKTSIF